MAAAEYKVPIGKFMNKAGFMNDLSDTEITAFHNEYETYTGPDVLSCVKAWSPEQISRMTDRQRAYVACVYCKNNWDNVNQSAVSPVYQSWDPKNNLYGFANGWQTRTNKVQMMRPFGRGMLPDLKESNQEKCRKLIKDGKLDPATAERLGYKPAKGSDTKKTKSRTKPSGKARADAKSVATIVDSDDDTATAPAPATVTHKEADSNNPAKVNKAATDKAMQKEAEAAAKKARKKRRRLAIEAQKKQLEKERREAEEAREEQRKKEQREAEETARRLHEASVLSSSSDGSSDSDSGDDITLATKKEDIAAAAGAAGAANSDSDSDSDVVEVDEVDTSEHTSEPAPKKRRIVDDADDADDTTSAEDDSEDDK